MLLLILFVLVSTFESFTIQQQLGIWYQIANTPQFYEQNYPFCTTATYSLLANQSVLIVNSARDAPSLQASTCTVYGTGTPVTDALWDIKLWSNPCSTSLNIGQIAAQLQWLDIQNDIALLAGPTTYYVLARTPSVTLPSSLLEQLHLTPTVQAGCW